jgi:uridylate kinase
MRVTICFGGSIIAPEKPSTELFQEIAKTVHALKSKKCEVLIVTGGGGPARMFMEAAKKFGASPVELDKIGIDVTRLHARMLISALGEIAEPKPMTTFEAAVSAALKNKVPVMGGTTPGHTTDAVAAMLAKVSRSDMLIFFSDVDGVYTADPNRDPKAKKIEAMTTRELGKRFATVKVEPGMKTIIDPVAAKLIERSKFKTLFMGVHEIKRLPKILEGASHSGTTIMPVSE